MEIANKGEPKAIPWTYSTPLKAAADAWSHMDIQKGNVVCWPTNLGWMMGPWLVYATLLNGASIAIYDGSPLGPGFAKFVQSNPVLEAFGNAKTVRNNNLSRFGKFVEIQLDQRGRISGAAIRTYLLERSRVCQIAEPERNYHCLYMLCAAPQEDDVIAAYESDSSLAHCDLDNDTVTKIPWTAGILEMFCEGSSVNGFFV